MPASSLKNIMGYTKKDARLTSTKNYKPKYTKKYKAEDFKYVTNTKKKTQKIIPSGRAGVSSKADNRIHFALNMTPGKGGYANTAKYFDRIYSVYPEYELTGLCPYVFIVRPDTNILTTDGSALTSYSTSREKYKPNFSPNRDEFFRWMWSSNKAMLRSISGDYYSGHDFIPFLVGRTESLNLADYSVKEYKINQPFTNYNLPYAANALESTSGGNFDITFRDDYQLHIHRMFNAWLRYIDGVVRNLWGPRDVYLRQNRIDYACSVYYIVCGPDAQEIVFWAKYTGAIPTSVPNSDQSFNLRGEPNNKITIPFSYFRQEVYDPKILIDFNKNAKLTPESKEGQAKYKKTSLMPVYNTTLGNSFNNLKMKDPRTAERKAMKVSPSTTIRYPKGSPIALGPGNGLVGKPYIYKVGKSYYLGWYRASTSIIPD